MSVCEQYESELSALLDAESNPATAIKVLDHVASCPSCRAFYRELRSFQEFVDRVPVVMETSAPAQAEVATETSLRLSWRGRLRSNLGSVPEWAWGLAAVLIVAVGLVGVLTVGTPNHPTSTPAGDQLTIQLEENKGQMNDYRFLEIATELLQAGRRYHQKMYEILDRIRSTGSAEEGAALYASRQEGEEREGRREVLSTSDHSHLVN
jgi:hypothetical protein